MKSFCNYLSLLAITLLLTSCNDNKPIQTTQAEEIYDFRNEKYQDFYSKFMREVEKKDRGSITPNNIFSRTFDYKFIQQYFNIKNANKNIIFKINVMRTDPNNKQIGALARYQNLEEFLSHKKKNGYEYTECNKEKQIKGLFCIDEKVIFYHYIPKDKNARKIRYINQNFEFNCTLNCKLFEYPSYPYNIRISIHFSNPEDFFYILYYVEKYFFDTTGEHIWQRSIK